MQRMKKPEVKNIKTRQQIKKGRSKRCCRRQSTWLIINPLLHRYCTAIVLLLLRRCCSIVASLPHRYRTGIAPLLLRYFRSCCRYAVAPISHRYRATVAPLLSLLLSLRSCSCYRLRCRSVVALLSNRCHSVADDVAPAVATV